MSSVSEESRKKILNLLRYLPHPGRVLLDSVGEGIGGFYLRPKSLPQKLDVRDVPLWLMRGDKTFDEGQLFALNLGSQQWQEWVKQRPAFVIRAEDVGAELRVVEEREKNFNKNLLHEFLDQMTVVISIDKGYLDGLQNDDSYTCYFWDHSSSVSGTSHCSDMMSIKVGISGIEECSAIVTRNSLYLKYWQLLQDKDKIGMKVLLMWHRALISLNLLLKKDNVCIPINFKELERTCLKEIENVFKD